MRQSRMEALTLVAAVVAALAAGIEARAQIEREPLPPFLNLPTDLRPTPYTFVRVFEQVTVANPVRMVYDPRGDQYFVPQREGSIVAFDNRPDAVERVILDLSETTQWAGDAGLLGFVLHPDFGDPESANGAYFYVWYNYSAEPENPPAALDTPSRNRLSRFEMTDGAADLDSEFVLIDQASTTVLHNGGAMFFHPDDGFLYFTVGDDDRPEGRQRVDLALNGGVFRIDVDQDPARSHAIRRTPDDGVTQGYLIPNDNPFLDAGGGVLEEYWSLGLRSPHTMSYDAIDERLWLADVGASLMEEIDLVLPGGNYQWSYAEGTYVKRDPPEDLVGVDTPPVYAYDRLRGDGAVIGGFVYRGNEFPELEGRYLFGDFVSNRIWALALDGDAVDVEKLGTLPECNARCGGLTAIEMSAEGEPLFLRLNEEGIWALARLDTPEPVEPQLLSETGLFSDTAELTPAPGVLPYEVNGPLWSDGAAKERWIALPMNVDGELDPLTEQIGFSPTGEWTFPPGTVLVKHFELPTDESDPDARVRLETRVLVVKEGAEVYGLTYRWRADGLDAELLDEAGEDVDYTIRRADGSTFTQTWSYPSRDACLACHTVNAGGVIGLTTRQLNRAVGDAEAGENQLALWQRIGMFSNGPAEDEITGLDRLVSIRDETADIETRVRSYLDANCAHCHRPGGARALFDARFDTSLEAQGIVDGDVLNTLEIADARVIAPGDASRSVLYQRLSALGESQMPPLGRNVVDEEALGVVERWIDALGEADTQPLPIGICGAPAFTALLALGFAAAARRGRRARTTRSAVGGSDHGTP